MVYDKNGTGHRVTVNMNSDLTRWLADHLGIPREETMAFGDGENDISMLKAAGTGVAMGNAAEDVMSAAGYVTTSVDENGVYNALKHFNII